MKSESIDSHEVLQRIQKEMLKQRITQSELMAYLGIDATVFNMWKKGKSKSFLKYIEMIADYLGVTVDSLTRPLTSESLGELTEEEKKIINIIRSLSIDQRRIVCKMIDGLTFE